MTAAPSPRLGRWPSVWAALTTLVLVGLAALMAAGAERWLDPESLALFFVAPILIAAIRYGLWASLGASFLSALSINFLFVEPRYTFVVARPQDVAALFLFSVVAVLASAIAARARSAALNAERRAREAELLRHLATVLAGSVGEDEIAAAAVTSLSKLSGRPALLVGADDRTCGDGFDQTARDAARWSMSTKHEFHPSADAPVASAWSFWPIVFAGRCEMAIGVHSLDRAAPDLSHAAEQIAAQVGLAMERARVARAEEAARLNAERERLKSDILAGVSHDLRTPLSTIVFSLQSLQKFAAGHPTETRDELLALAEQEARRLAGLVETLLDASRIGVEGAPVRIEGIAAVDLIERARAELGAACAEGDIQVSASKELPEIAADPALAARALANVLSNALRHGGAPVRIEAQCKGDRVIISVSDDGPGLGAEPDRLFEPFVRGVQGDGRAPGLGLGLSIAKTFLESQGAAISAANRPDGGALFALSFPIALREAQHGG